MSGPPNLTYSQVPTAGQWNQYFTQKQDTLGYTPLNQAGGSMSGKLQTVAATNTAAGFSLLPGVAPVTPADGDLWITSTGLYARVLGVTINIPSDFATSSQGAKANSALQPTAIGVSVQAYSSTLSSISSLALQAGDICYATGASTLQRLPIGAANQALVVSGGLPSWATLPNTGNVTGAASSVDGDLALFSGTTGKILKDGGPITAAGLANVNVTGAPVANGLVYLTSTTAAAITTLSSLARSLIAGTTGSAMWTTMGGVFSGNATSGYLVRPDGTIRVWGQSSNDTTTPFGTAMPNAVLSHGANATNANTSTSEIVSIEASAITTTGITWRPRYSNGGAVGVASQTYKWWAEGY